MKSGNLATKRLLRQLGLNQMKALMDEIGLNDYEYMIVVLHFHEKKDLFTLSRLSIDDMQKFKYRWYKHFEDTGWNAHDLYEFDRWLHTRMKEE